MSRLTVLFLLAVGLLLGVHPVFAATFIVGTCKPSLSSYATISAAVSNVPPGSTVEVCPGTYPEQVTIAQPLTLKGITITSENAGQVVITVPGSPGLIVVTGGFGESIAAQVAVTANAGPVNISDITVDGTGSTVPSPSWLAGVFYESGSSGTVNEVTVRNLSASGRGVGVWAENAGATNELVTIENSSFHDIDDSAVVTDSNQPTPFALVKGNYMETAGYYVQWGADGSLTQNFMFGGYALLIAGPGTVSGNTVANSSAYGIYLDGLAPTTVSGNTVTNTFEGIYSFSPGTISGNTVTNTTFGILEFADGISATSNKISNASLIAIYVHNSDDSVQSNTITHAYVGIEFDCKTATVLHNTINDATSGMELVPVGFSGANTFNNVETLRYGNCGSASVRGPDLPTAPHSGPIPMRALP